MLFLSNIKHKLRLFKLRSVLLLAFVLLALSNTAFKPADTISAEGIEFTPIETSSAVKPQTVKTSQSAGSIKQAAKPVKKEGQNQSSQTLWAIFLAGLAWGATAIFMPCIFPMLPFTVSYFIKQSRSRAGAIRSALSYGLSIIVIYVVLGILITVVFGADALNNLATNGVFNMLFFLLLIVFAASFLGAFEINLPTKWVNKMDQNADRGGFAGLFFMAATLSLVSFSCTGPLIGTLLVQAAVSGALLGPAVGMLGFSVALAIPFTLFALFPSLLKSLPKSGGWLNSIKVVLGFLELALALKFLSNVDLAYHWHWFDREVFLVLWIIIFALMGLYLLGKLTFAHDSPIAYVSVTRLFLSIIVFAFALYMIPGLWGAPLKSISAFLPPKATQDFDLSVITPTVAAPIAEGARPQKYMDVFGDFKPKGFNPFFDYDEALAYAKKVNKPLMIDFTGHACVNCRKMEENVWPDVGVANVINQEYVLVQLYVDDKKDLLPADRMINASGDSITTIGKKWSYLQTSKFQANSQPFYVLLNAYTEQPLVEPQGANYDAAQYLDYLKSGLSVFKNKL